jgi:hypothetical protein
MTRPEMRSPCAAALFVFVILAVAGCKGPTDPSQNRIEPFTGAVQPLMAGPAHSFTVSNTGELTVTMTALAPGNVYVGLGYGTPAGGQCQFQQASPVSSANIGKASLFGSVFIKGAYCVQVFDPSLTYPGYSALTVPQNYTVQVSHP